MTGTSIDGKVQRIQTMLYSKANAEPETRFKDLYKYLNKQNWAELAMARVLRNRGSRTPGIDGMTRSNLKDAEQQRLLIETLKSALKNQTYTPQPARRVYIPKPNGKQRPLGIPTIRDRIVQEMVRMLLEPIYEARFLPCSYGFRPQRCTWDALAEVHHMLKPNCQYYTVIEGDIQNCFGTINHTGLMNEVKRVIQDKRLLHLIWIMLKAGIMEDLQYFATDEGTPQGGPLSPLLANIYLHRLDEWFHHRYHTIPYKQREKRRNAGELGSVRYIRYADDFVVLTRGTPEQAETLKQTLTAYIREELAMTLSAEKTLITDARDGFDFLGVRTIVAPYRSNPNKLLPFQMPSEKSITSYKRRIYELTRQRYDYRTPSERIIELNWIIEGWATYHHWGNAKAAFGALSYWTLRRVIRMLRRYTRAGRRATHAKHFRTITECTNLKRWKRYTQWTTPAVQLDEQHWLGVLPMKLISTKDYWRYRGKNIPAIYAGPDGLDTTKLRSTEFSTAEQAIQVVAHAENKHYPTLYVILRKQVFRRDGHRCTDCGYQSQRKPGEVHDIECHHIDPAEGHTMENLTTLCIACHLQRTLTKQVRQM